MNANLSTIEYEASRVLGEDFMLYQIFGGDGFKQAVDTAKRIMLLDTTEAKTEYPKAVLYALKRAMLKQVDFGAENEYLNYLCDILGGIAHSLFECGIIE